MTTIEVRADQIYRLADTLQNLAAETQQVSHDLDGTPSVDGGLQSAIEGFLTDHRTAAHALTGELRWLADTFGAVAGSWVQLDRYLLSGHDGASAE
jgi:ABC-type transporter Mla subunit MlaD